METQDMKDKALIERLGHLPSFYDNDRRQYLGITLDEREAIRAALTRTAAHDCEAEAASYPNGCPGCGAPVCCERCCKEATRTAAADPDVVERAARKADPELWIQWDRERDNRWGGSSSEARITQSLQRASARLTALAAISPSQGASK